MQITIESTDQIVRMDGVQCRLWHGVADNGLQCHVFVHRIGGKDLTDEQERLLLAELIEQRSPAVEVPLAELVLVPREMSPEAMQFAQHIGDLWQLSIEFAATARRRWDAGDESAAVMAEACAERTAEIAAALIQGDEETLAEFRRPVSVVDHPLDGRIVVTTKGTADER